MRSIGPAIARRLAVPAPWRPLTVALALTLVFAPPAAAGVPDPAPLDSVLVRHLRSARVDYGALARERGALDRWLAAAAKASLAGASPAAQQAFWINAYNAHVLAGVLRWPGLARVLDVGKSVAPGQPGFFARRVRVAGRDLSLDDIEHTMLRKRFGDPRLHFVLNCASVSCPDLPARALREATLDSVLSAATRAFLADRTRNRVAGDGTLELSQLFQWYAEDFSREPGGVAGFAARHGLRTPAPAGRAQVRYLDYDWALNGRW